MGPRRQRRGRREKSQELGCEVGRLQWGHGVSAVDDLPRPGSVASGKGLQWGHGVSAVDDSTRATGSSASRRGFNGATASAPWMTSDTAFVVVGGTSGFN